MEILILFAILSALFVLATRPSSSVRYRHLEEIQQEMLYEQLRAINSPDPSTLKLLSIRHKAMIKPAQTGDSDV